jgi:hypothetical protein
MGLGENTMIGYKIVRSHGGKLLSLLHQELPDVWVVEYKPGEWARPTIGKLFAWSVEPPSVSSVDQLWLAELENATNGISWVISPYNPGEMLERFIPRYWRGDYYPPEYVRVLDLGRGTVTCDAIKLLERVKQ